MLGATKNQPSYIICGTAKAVRIWSVGNKIHRCMLSFLQYKIDFWEHPCNKSV